MSSNSSQSSFDCGEQGLRYVAGYIAHKLRPLYPDLGCKTCDEGLFVQDLSPWITQLSRGGLINPSEDFLATIKKFEVHFNALHKEKLDPSKGVISRLVQTLQLHHPDVALPIIKKYCRTRTFIRLKHLNREIKSLAHLKQNQRQLNYFRT